MISMWSSPRNPQRKPKPSAIEVSGSKLNAESLSRSFSSASRSASYSVSSIGIEPGEDHRLGLAEPGQRRGGGPRRVGDRLADARVGDAA